MKKVKMFFHNPNLDQYLIEPDGLITLEYMIPSALAEILVGRKLGIYID